MAGDSGSSYVADATGGYRDAILKLRARADASAKAIGVLGTSVITAIGISKFADVFPFPGGGLAWVGLTQALAALNVIRKRAHGAVFGKMPVCLYILFAVAIVSFGISADYLDNRRAGPANDLTRASNTVALAKSCADATPVVGKL